MRFLGHSSKVILVMGMVLLLVSVGFAQTGSLKGRITDSESNQPLMGATVLLVGTKMGAAADVAGNFTVTNIPAGSYTIRITYLGYISQEQRIAVSEGEATLNVRLVQSAIQQREVIVEVNRAKERETPVAFSNIGTDQISKKLHTQDAPLLIRNTPGVYAYSTDGVGNGESKLFVRGFDQNRVQVLINGIPTNDPESNSVYWSNWGAVSSAAASVQVQRGAGSSLYGAGSFGGSFNIITTEVAPKFGADAHYSYGSPELNVYGATISSGLMANNLVAASLTYDWKTGRGGRRGAYYEGANYYAGVALYPDAATSVKLVLHGGPQEHGYSYSGPIAFFKKYGYDANPAYFLPVAVLDQTVGTGATAKTLRDSLRIGGDSRFVLDSKYIGLAHNFYHKPQLELHATRDIDENNTVRGTFFYSVGRGAGSSVNSASNYYNALTGNDTLATSTGTLAGTLAIDPLTGEVRPDAVGAAYVATRFLKNAYQRISYSLHQQWGFIGSWDMKVNESMKFTVGGEYRSWFADHPGYFTNLFGKPYLDAQSYAYKNNGVLRTTFTRRTYQSDMKDFGGSEKLDVNYMNPFMSYTLNDENGTYNGQYRNYVGETKQYTAFLQGSYKLQDIIFTGSVQYVDYSYHVKENMPSENAIGDSVAAPASAKEGPDGAGNFYMVNSANTRWYRFTLVDDTRTRGFWQPKFGVNYNMTDEFNVFASYSHVERFADLSVYYNSGNINRDAKDEISDQLELGGGYQSAYGSAKVNLYRMTWDNKTASISDISKAGQPGYDRNGNRYELVGSSTNQGLEFEGTLKLDAFLPIKGIVLNASFTMMDNKWTKVLDEVKTTTNAAGATIRRAFNASALNANGVVDTLYFDELDNTINASGPFTVITYGLTYSNDSWFVGINAMTTMSYYALDGGTFTAIDGYWAAPGQGITKKGSAFPTFEGKFSDKLPDATIIDVQAGMYLNFHPAKVRVTAQIQNLFNTKYFAAVDRNGLYPGLLRAYRVNMAVGL